MNLNKKAAIITASGFGDGLIMLVAAKCLKENGYEVTVFNNTLPTLSPLLPDFLIFPHPEHIDKYFDFDFIILQNDNSERSKKIVQLRAEKNLNLTLFYPSYNREKHGPLHQKDIPFDAKLTMVENLILACKRLFPKSYLAKNSLDGNIGLQLPLNLVHRKYLKRVAIHPLSGIESRNWPLNKFIKLANMLEKKGYEPIFTLSTKEKKTFAAHNVKIKAFDSLSSLAEFLFESAFFIGNESGPSHLASYLNIPSIIPAGHRKRMKLWQPGWKKAKVITPPAYIPNLKGLRLKEKRWGFFIPAHAIFKAFKQIVSLAEDCTS